MHSRTTGPLTLAVIAGLVIAAGEPRAELATFEVDGDAVRTPLSGLSGRPERGRDIVVDRRKGNCLICHRVPSLDIPFQGEIGPSLAGVARRLKEGEIRLRLIDQSRINPATTMPPYYRIEGLRDVAPADRGKPALNAQEIEDVVAFLLTLKE
jgi:sulfur-oxidizing protein SoxX